MTMKPEHQLAVLADARKRAVRKGAHRPRHRRTGRISLAAAAVLLVVVLFLIAERSGRSTETMAEVLTPSPTAPSATSATSERSPAAPGPFAPPTSESATASSNDHRLVPTGIEGLSVEVPSSWIPDPDRPSDHVGDDGFIKFATRGIEFTPAELAERSASHHLAPYGSAPTIESETMSGLAVAVVRPSDDGIELEGFTFGEIIVGTEPALSIVTDVGHLDAIRASLEAQVGATREGS